MKLPKNELAEPADFTLAGSRIVIIASLIIIITFVVDVIVYIWDAVKGMIV